MGRLKKGGCLSVLLASRNIKTFAAVQQVTAKNRMRTNWAGNGAEALEMIREDPHDLIIMEESLPDMSARQLVEMMVTINPFVYCAVAGSINEKSFHDLYEGYGVLMQLPAVPDLTDTEKLLEMIRKINRMGETLG